MGTMVFPGELAELLPEIKKTLPPKDLKFCETAAHIELQSLVFANLYNKNIFDTNTIALNDAIVANALKAYPNKETMKPDKFVYEQLKDIHETAFSGNYDIRSFIAGAGMEKAKGLLDYHDEKKSKNSELSLSEVNAAIFEVMVNNQCKLFEGKSTDETPSSTEIEVIKNKMLNNPSYRKQLAIQYTPVAKKEIDPKSYEAGLGKQRSLNNKQIQHIKAMHKTIENGR